MELWIQPTYRPEAYKAIIEAEKFEHNLTLQFGILASKYKNEDEYLKKSIMSIEEKKIAKGRIFMSHSPCDYYI